MFYISDVQPSVHLYWWRSTKRTSRGKSSCLEKEKFKNSNVYICSSVPACFCFTRTFLKPLGLRLSILKFHQYLSLNSSQTRSQFFLESCLYKYIQTLFPISNSVRICTRMHCYGIVTVSRSTDSVKRALWLAEKHFLNKDRNHEWRHQKSWNSTLEKDQNQTPIWLKTVDSIVNILKTIF